MSLPEKDPVLTLMQRRDTFEAFVPSSLYMYQRLTMLKPAQRGPCKKLHRTFNYLVKTLLEKLFRTRLDPAPEVYVVLGSEI